MLIDTHCHLNFKDFDSDRDEIIGRCLDPSDPSGQVWLINIGVNYETSKEVINIAQKHDKGVYATVALHPHDVTGDGKREREDFDYGKFLELAKNKKVVAIGETGLDYAFCENDKKAQELQQKVFIQHLKLAQEVNKPIVIHSRRTFPEILSIIQNSKFTAKGGSASGGKIQGVLHCYMGRWSYAEEYLKLGFYLSFTGLITYARDYDKVIRNAPLERILIETDAPYLIPEPLRKDGEITRNEPKNVEYVAHKIAEIKEIPFEKVATQTTQNAKELFNLL
jgi:TatD DNase family protein